MIFNALRWLERLSLDAVAVAVLWGLALEQAAGRSMRTGEIVVLALATWLTYVADRLRDAGPDADTPGTDRHQFHERHRKRLVLTWLVVFTLAVGFAVVVLPAWKVLGGWALVLAVAVYLWLLKHPLPTAQRLLLKRLAVPAIFTLGVVWMVEGWRTGAGLVAAMVLLLAALANVLLISCEENRRREQPGWLWPFLGWSLFGLLMAGNAALLLDWRLGAAALACALAYFGLTLRVKTAEVRSIRIWVDAVLAAAAVFLIVAG